MFANSALIWRTIGRSAVDTPDNTTIADEVERLASGLVYRVRVVKDRYVDALPELERRVEDYGAKVEGHLRRTGLSA